LLTLRSELNEEIAELEDYDSPPETRPRGLSINLGGSGNKSEKKGIFTPRIFPTSSRSKKLATPKV
jgi:hypothetical protein